MEKSEYVKQREVLIPVAEFRANVIVDADEYRSEEDRRARWNYEFHLEMDRLADERIYKRAWRR